MRALLGLLLCASIFCVSTAHAAPRLLVMRADSSTDLETRKRVEAGVLGLARNVDRGAGQGDSSFKDIADAVGCVGDVGKCKTAVIETLDVDELVVITIEPAGAQAKVTVRRASKNGEPRTATAVVDKANVEAGLASGIGPLFGSSKVVEAPKSKAGGGDAPVVAQTRGEAARAELAASQTRSSPTASPSPAAAPAPAASPAPAPSPTVASAEPSNGSGELFLPPTEQDRPGFSSREKLYVGGIVAGSALAVVGVVLWKKAGDLQDEIKRSPNRTQAEVDHLLDLESRGDSYALWGNVTFIGGVAIAGVSSVLLWRSRRAHATPMAVNHGAGVAFTWEVP